MTTNKGGYTLKYLLRRIELTLFAIWLVEGVVLSSPETHVDQPLVHGHYKDGKGAEEEE